MCVMKNWKIIRQTKNEIEEKDNENIVDETKMSQFVNVSYAVILHKKNKNRKIIQKER